MTEFKQERSNERCLTLLCSSVIEETVLDFLLMSNNVLLFTSTSASVHGLKMEISNPSEQVLGRVAMTQIQALVEANYLQELVISMQERFKGTGIRYWVTEVISGGEIQ
ncbi:DUF3240 family protein [Acinetobacter junii]|uniref:DUF3240 family protein n=1 Tax=Acinetobacter junii TaxID=40215 RepID=UPI00124DC6C4|nr:DUF3240 family protein [Acinetobacter junii]